MAEFETYDLPTRMLTSVQYGTADHFQAKPENALLDYVREFNTINPRMAPALATPIGQWMHCHEHLDEAFAQNDRFYQEFAPVYDCRYASVLMIPIDERVATFVGIQRSHRLGPFSDEARSALIRLGNHLRDARLAYEKVRRLASQAMAGHSLLASFAYPMWLIDSDRFVLYANDAANSFSQAAEHVSIRNQRLSLLTSTNEREFSNRIAAAYAGQHGAASIIDLRRFESDPPIFLHLSLLVPGKVLGAFGERSQILVTLFDPRSVSTLDPFALANLFQLSPAEARVATQIAEGLTPDAIATANGIRISTVRSQISAVIAKIGVQRQVDIVRVLRQGEALWSLARRET